MTAHAVYMPPGLRALAMAILLGGLLAACIGSSPNPALYTIEPIPGEPRRGGPGVVVLRQVGVARLLERSQIVRSSDSYRLDVMSNDWWGEPLGAMLDRVLVEELGQRLPQSTVLNENSAVSATPDATVELAVQRLDQDRGINVILQAQASITRRRQAKPSLRNLRIVEPVKQAGTVGQVEASSVAVARLADELAAILVSR
jgi:uncharacterized lipoprotein YmbA